MIAEQGSEDELRELAREHPEEFQKVAERVGGPVEARLLDLLDDETEVGR